jgi:hypothetical protein
MTNKILFYSNQTSNRLLYTVSLVFNEILGLDVIFTQSKDIFINSNIPKVNFSDSSFHNNEIYIKPHFLIFESKINSYAFNLETFGNLDIFSRIFYLVSRYEEYSAPSSVFDPHNRFVSTASLSKKLGILYQPVVNQWIIQLKNDLKQHNPTLVIPESKYHFQPTYDIDQAWAYKNKGYQRNIGGFFKDTLHGKMTHAVRRVGALVGFINDPEFNFDYMEKLHKKHNLNPLFFWLLADHGEFDKNIDWQNGRLQSLIRRIAHKYGVGIHPSYKSNTSFPILKMEKGRLENMLKLPPLSIIRSRQHFLKLRFPETYRNLLKANILEDFSMGYADDIGFRAGIATPFYWYDLENEQVTPLKIHPFQVMEVTLQQYLALSPDEAIEKVKPLIVATKAVGGTFTTLWHNSTLSDVDEWKGWRKVYESVIAEALN